MTVIRNNPEPGELHEATQTAIKEALGDFFFFPSCDVQKEVDSIDCSFTCSHFERMCFLQQGIWKKKISHDV